MANRDSLNVFNDLYKRWEVEIDIVRVIKKEYGKLSFEELEQPLRDFQSKLQQIHEVQESIPSALLNQINTQLSNIHAWSKRVSNFNEQEFTGSRSNYLGEIRQFLDSFDGLWVNVLPIIHEARIGKSSDFINQFEESAKKSAQLLSEQEVELNDLRNKFKDVYGSVAIEKESQRFEQTSNEFLNNANKWGWRIFIRVASK